jgi:nitrite reductase/ring-hydroxylating ferredoxin subunit
MDLPASVTALGEQLRGAGNIMPDPALFDSADVFAAERERIFIRPWVAADHETRLSEDGRYFRFEAATRSVIVTRDDEGRLHALRNVCIHAGYPVCDAEEGPAQRLICPYHGWEYTLDGRLVEPALTRIDPARLQMTRYPVNVRNGLIFVDPSGKIEAFEEIANSVPAWLADARVMHRARYNTKWNWKFVHHFLRSSPHLFFDASPDGCLEFGPLSLMFVRSQRAALLRVIPKFAEQTDFQVIQMVAADAPEEAAAPADAVAEALRGTDASQCWFDRRFGDWYWSLMSAA